MRTNMQVGSLTTSLPKNRLYSLFSFRFRSPSLKRFYYLSDRTVVHDFFLVKFVNLRDEEDIEFPRSFTPLSLLIAANMQCHEELRIQEKKKKRKKKCCKRVVVPPFDFLEVYYEILIAGENVQRKRKKEKKYGNKLQRIMRSAMQSNSFRDICEHLLYTINHDRSRMVINRDESWFNRC